MDILGSSTAGVMESVLAESLGGIAMQSTEMLSARQASGVKLAPNPYSSTNSYGELMATMKGLALEIEDEDPWIILGVPKFEGPPPEQGHGRNKGQGWQAPCQPCQKVLVASRSGEGEANSIHPRSGQIHFRHCCPLFVEF